MGMFVANGPHDGSCAYSPVYISMSGLGVAYSDVVVVDFKASWPWRVCVYVCMYLYDTEARYFPCSTLPLQSTRKDKERYVYVDVVDVDE